MITIDTLLPFSGGNDSTLVLYNYLKNNPNKTLLVYHVVLSNFEGRQDLELNAVNNILDWLRSQGLNNFEYHQAAFDYGTIKKIVYDVEIWSVFDGILLRNKRYADVNTILCPYIKTAHQAEMLTGRHRKRVRITKIISGRDVEYKMPIIDMDKEAILNALPAPLRPLIWYCRQPIDGKPCHKCFTCIAVDNAVIHS